MKRILMTVASLLMSAMSIQGQELCVDVPCACDYSRLYVGPQLYYTNLKVENTDSSLAGLLGLENSNTSLGGVMYGVNGGYEYEKPWGLYANIDLNYGQGKLKKSGGLTRYIHEYDVSAVAGYCVGGGDECCWSLIPYAGFGHLTQNHTLTSFHVKYRYSIYYVPVGIKFDCGFYAYCGYWTAGLDVAVLPQVDSTTKINLLKGARWSLAKRTDWLVSVPIEYYSDCCPLSVKLDLFWKSLGIGGSKAVTEGGIALGLPPSKWNAIGASLDLVWEF